MNTVIDIAPFVFFALIIIMQAGLSVAQHISVNTCDPCNGYSLDHISRNRLQLFLKYSVYSGHRIANSVLVSAQRDYGVTPIDTLDLTECCGTTYDMQEGDMNIQSIRQLTVSAIINLNDASYLVDNDHEANNLHTAIQNLNTTLCTLDTMESTAAAATTTTTTTTSAQNSAANTASGEEECLVASQIDSCTQGLSGQGATCHMNMLFRYLTNAVNILTYIKHSGRV